MIAAMTRPLPHRDSPAEQLLQALRLGIVFSAEPSGGPGSAAAAYMAQAVVWQALAGEARPGAWKVGASARDAEPLAAPVLPQRLVVGQGNLDRRLFPGGVAVEAEIAFRFGRDLPARAEPHARTAILDAIASAHVAMEVISSRLADTREAGALWGLADNLYNGALVLGEPVAAWRDVDWGGQLARVLADGKDLAEPGGRPPLGDPFHCLAWWLDHVGGARAGDIVTTGAWSGAHPAGRAELLVAEFAGLGRAQLRIEG